MLYPMLAEDMLPGQTPIEVALDVILRSDKPFVFIRDRLRVTGLLGLSDFNGNAFARLCVFSGGDAGNPVTVLVDNDWSCSIVVQQIGHEGLKRSEVIKILGLNYSPCHYLYFKDLLNLCGSIGFMRI